MKTKQLQDLDPVQRALSAYAEQDRITKEKRAQLQKEEDILKLQAINKHFHRFKKFLDTLMGEDLDWAFVNIDGNVGNWSSHLWSPGWIDVSYGERVATTIALRVYMSGHISWTGHSSRSNTSKEINNLADLGRCLKDQAEYLGYEENRAFF